MAASRWFWIRRSHEGRRPGSERQRRHGSVACPTRCARRNRGGGCCAQGAATAPRRLRTTLRDGCGVDVGARDGDAVIGTLAKAMDGASAVIHLAWAIQPNHDRGRLRRTNVLGTSRMLAAVRATGIDNVVVASSVGAYSPCHDDVPHDETWPTDGVQSCEYSVDKADVEQLLDEHVRAHPEVIITRLRPALIFQRGAGSEIMRYFVGSLVPGANPPRQIARSALARRHATSGRARRRRRRGLPRRGSREGWRGVQHRGRRRTWRARDSECALGRALPGSPNCGGARGRLGGLELATVARQPWLDRHGRCRARDGHRASPRPTGVVAAPLGARHGG